MGHWAFLIIFSECFSFSLLYTDKDNVPWEFFDKKFIEVSSKIEITCDALAQWPNLTTINKANTHKHIFIEHCSINKTYFHTLMESFDNEKIETIQMECMTGLENFEDGYFVNLKSLKSLFMKYNKIEMLNENTFEGMKNLSRLNICFNKLESLKSNTFNSVQKLRNLDLSHNKLRHLPDDIFTPVYNLYSLRIGNNSLTNLTSNIFKNLTNLRVLSLENNIITYLSDYVFNEVVRLEFLALSNNTIRVFPERVFGKLAKLKKLYMTNASHPHNTSLFENIFINNTKLEKLHLDSNNLITLPENLFSQLVKLEELKLNNNKLTELNENVFKNNVCLEKLYLDDNMLSTLGRNTFRSLQKLNILSLQNNQLKSLHPEVFSSLTDLSAIYLANNQVNMSGLEPDVSNLRNCRKIETIGLKKNLVTRIYSDWLNEHRYLNQLDLSFNPIVQESNYSSFMSRSVNVTLINIANFKENLIPGMIQYENNEVIFSQFNNDINYCIISCTCWYYNRGDEEYLVLNCQQVNEYAIQLFFQDLNLRIKMIQRFAHIEDVKVLLSGNSPGALNLFKPLLENVHVTHLSLAASNLTNLDDLPILSKLKVLELHDNSFTSLREANIEKLQKMNNLINLTLNGNPWTCDCHAIVNLFAEFLNSTRNGTRIIDPNNVTCNSTGVPYLKWHSARSGFCASQGLSIFRLLLCMFAGSVCSIVITWTSYRFRNEIKVWMFSHKMLRWLVTEKEIDRDKKYDAFVSYSHIDEWFVANELVPQLEGGPNPYKLCIHTRDWLAGAYIPTQINKSVNDSKRTIIILSPNFLTSFWAKMEFHEAYIKAMRERCPRVIVILLEDVGDHVNLDDELKVYLRTYTYIKWQDPRFWAKLKYALPHKPISEACD